MPACFVQDGIGMVNKQEQRVMVSLVPWCRAKLMASRVRRQATAYSACPTGEHDQWQLAAFNKQWRDISVRVPYWTSLRLARALPDCFASWDEVYANLPILGRSHLQSRIEELRDPLRHPAGWQATGGSTGRPVRIPVWRTEARLAADDVWWARSWFHIRPDDRAFMIWGHSHLLGHGLAGWLRGRVRIAKDRLLGYCRWSAYRIGEADLREAAQLLLRFRPRWLLGYAAALDRFALVNRDRRSDFAQLRLKAVIATGESFPHPDCRDRLTEILGCPVAMEYGAQEVGPIAHETPEGGYQVFWRSYHVEAIESNTTPGSRELVLTSLRPRCLPLVRYRIGDLIAVDEPLMRPLLKFRAVVGRCSDTIMLPQGRQVHSKALSHVLRGLPVTGYQLLQRSERELILRYTSVVPLTADQVAEIRRSLERVERSLGDISIERAEALEPTVAGKTKVVCRVG